MTYSPISAPVKVSRRGFLGGAAGLVLAVSLPATRARAQDVAPGTRVPAFLQIRPDGTAILRSPFAEGGQGIFTAMAQIVGEELDLAPDQFTVEIAPAGPDYLIMGGMRFTGGSASVRSSYDIMRKLGATARAMLIAAAADRLKVPASELTTEPGRVLHATTGESIGYGDLAEAAMALQVPADVTLRDTAAFRWIGQPVQRLDVRDKSTGKAIYTIDQRVDGMVYAAVQHAPRMGGEPGDFANEAEVAAMPGVQAIHHLPGAVAVLADSWWRARRAVETLTVTWAEPAAGTPGAMPADFSSEAHRAALAAVTDAGAEAEASGDFAAAHATADRKIDAVYMVPHLNHAQMEPPSTLARFNDDGTLELWLPCQAPEMFQAEAARIAGITPENVQVHSQLMGGFFGRHFLYGAANPFPQAILLAQLSGKPVKVVWSREEEFLRDTLRPTSVVRLLAGLDASGNPVALEAIATGEGPNGRLYGQQPGQADRSAVEGLSGKVYAIPATRIAHALVPDPASIGYWRSVGHSVNDFIYEAFLDEIAEAGGKDPFDLRIALLANSPRQLALLQAVADLSGGWQRGPYAAPDGTNRARGVAMASPFGSEVATIAEVSLQGGTVVVHDIWVAIDPGSIVNPAIIEAQVTSAVALGLSQTLVEAQDFEGGQPVARNYDGYAILTSDLMPKVHVRIIESGAAIGGIGEPGVPGVAPAVVNAVAVLTGQRIRSLPLSRAGTLTERQG